MLTPMQVSFFETFGFVVLKQAYPSEEMWKLIAEAESLWAEEYGRPPGAGDGLHVSEFIEKRPLLAALAEDDRIHGSVKQLLGDDMIWAGSEGAWAYHDDNAAHTWHADRPGAAEIEYTRVKVMLYIDPMRKEKGAFRVIPGSHKPELHSALKPFQDVHPAENATYFGMDGAETPCHALETDPGDVAIFHQSLFHSVYGKTGRRRYIALKFAERPRNDDHLKSLQLYSQDTFKPHESFRNSDRPQIQRMIEGLIELGEKAAALAD